MLRLCRLLPCLRRPGSVLLLGVFLLSQSGIALHFHGIRSGVAAKLGISERNAKAAPAAKDCRICALASQARVARSNAPAAIVVLSRAECVVVGSRPAAASSVLVRRSARGPPGPRLPA
jgi:hypothetical protein